MATGGITAAELMKQLEADPEYVARRRARDEQIEKLASDYGADEAALVAELRELGIQVDSVWDLVNNRPHRVLNRKFVGPYEAAYPILVKHLRIPHHERVREGIIRSLSEPTAYEAAARSLLEQLKIETEKSLRWVIENALKTMLPKAELTKHPEVHRAYEAGYL
jgi:hypothetical protein